MHTAQTRGFDQTTPAEHRLNPVTGHTLTGYTGHTGAVYAMAWSPDSTRLATGDAANGHVRVWDSVTGHTFSTFTRQTAPAWPAPQATTGRFGWGTRSPGTSLLPSPAAPTE